jgi:hypothetical protein
VRAVRRESAAVHRHQALSRPHARRLRRGRIRRLPRLPARRLYSAHGRLCAGRSGIARHAAHRIPAGAQRTNDAQFFRFRRQLRLTADRA